MAVKSSDQVTIVDLTDGYSVSLSMDAISFNGGVSQLGGNGQVITINVSALQGSNPVEPTVGDTTHPIVCSDPNKVTVNVGQAQNKVVPVSIQFDATLSAAGTITFPVIIGEVVIEKVFTYSISFTGATGATGATGTAAYNYSLIVSASAIVKAGGGAYDINSITLTAKRGQGTTTPANWSGGFLKVETYDGSSWTTRYGSSSDAGGATYTYPASGSFPTNLKAIRCSLYAEKARTTLLDQQTVPVISDGVTGATGATGSTGADAYTVILTNESHSFAAGVSAAVAGTATSKVVTYKGATQVTCYVGASASATSISTGITGLTCAITNNNSKNVTLTFTATASLTTKSGVVSIPVVVDGKSFTKQFTFSLSLTGATGKTGADGDDAILIAISASNGTVFKNATGNTMLTAHVYKGGQELSSDTNPTLASLGTLKWYKDGGDESVGTGTTLNVEAINVAKKAVYEVRLEA